MVTFKTVNEITKTRVQEKTSACMLRHVWAVSDTPCEVDTFFI